MSNEAEMPRRLKTIPGVVPITALEVETFALPNEMAWGIRAMLTRNAV